MRLLHTLHRLDSTRVFFSFVKPSLYNYIHTDISSRIKLGLHINQDCIPDIAG